MPCPPRPFSLALLICVAWAVAAGGCAESAPDGLDAAVRIGRTDRSTAALLAPNREGYTEWNGAYASPGFRASLRGERQQLAVLLPRTGNEAFTLGPGYASPLRITFAPTGARSVAGELHEGRVLYRELFEGVDEVAVTAPELAEQFYVLSAPSAAHDFSWRVTLPSGVARVEPRTDGIWFLDGAGGFVLRIPTPFYLDAAGHKYTAPATWQPEEKTLSIHVPREPAGAYPLLLDPAFETRVWTELRAPYTLNRPNFAYDVERKESILFGSNQTWTWDGASWNERAVARGGASPGLRYGASMIYDEKRKTAVLYGGVEQTDQGVGPGLDSTWGWNGVGWKNLGANNGPNGRLRGAFAYDRKGERGIYFGGQATFTDYTVYDETWIWDGTSWQQSNQAGPKPSKRAAAGLAYDVARDRVVLFGGYDNVVGVLGDTWEWANQTWTRVTSADLAPKPTPRHSFAMTYDEARNRIVMFSGSSNDAETWTFDGSRWKRETSAVSPPPLSADASATYDRIAKRVLLAGGQGPSGWNNSLWSWDGNGWRAERIGDLPEPYSDRYLMFEHPQRKELLLFAGAAAPEELRRPGYAWAHSGREWSQRTFLGAPVPRSMSDMTYDAGRGNVVLFGGSKEELLQDTWIYKAGEWSLAHPTTRPSARLQHKLAYHPGSNRVVLFGGADSSGLPGDTWLWDGQTWTDAKPATAPAGRRGHGLGLDPHTGKLILVGGKDVQGQSLSDTWSWNGVTWTQLQPAFVPDMSVGLALLCNPSDCFLSLKSNQMYRFVQNTWEQRADVSTPDWMADTSPSAAWDPRFDAFFLTGHETTIWKPEGEPKFSSDSSQFYDGPIAWTGTETIRFPESDDTGLGAAVYVRDLNDKWVRGTSQSIFPVRNGAATYDAARNTGVLVGRDNDGTARIWTWDGDAMRARASFPQGSAGAGMAMAYHAPSQTTVMFGGEAAERNTTYLWNGTSLAAFSPPNQAPMPAGRFGAAAAYDPKTSKVILFGGRDDIHFLGDTWAWDGNGWSQLSPKSSPSARANHAMTFDASTGSVLLLGGETATEVTGELWSWDGADWSLVTTKVSPPPRSLHAFAHVTAAHRSIAFGGNSIGPNAFPWALYSRGGTCTQNADCGTGTCVDGVCCEASSCGTCETCAGTDPGRCTAITNAEDPDTCPASNRVSCNERGQCGPALGGACKTGADCGSGNCVDGVCCDSACDKPCEACRASAKSTGKDDGRCGVAVLGSNPGKRCAGSATCSAVGVCAESTGNVCRDGRYLEDLAGTTTDCAPYRCAGKCLKRCSSANDCVFPATCDPSGVCRAPLNAELDDGSGCSVGGKHTNARATGAFVLCLVTVGILRRPRGRKRRNQGAPR